MALGKNRTNIFVRGLGNLEIALKEPTVDTQFSGCGIIKSALITDSPTMVDIVADNGQVVDFLPSEQRVGMEAQLYQVGSDEIALLRDAGGKVYALRYSGLTTAIRYQYYCMEACRLEPAVSLDFKVGERLLPLRARSLYQDVGYSIPLLYNVEATREIDVRGLQLWLAPRSGYNYGTAKLLDVSGFGRHGTISSAFATIWKLNGGTSLVKFLRFDGTADYVDYGDVAGLDFAATEDWMIEAWIAFPGTNGFQETICAKKQTVATSTDKGFALERLVGNTIQLRVSDGTTQVNTLTTSTVLQSTIKHVAFTVKKGGNVTPYMNGAADGTPVAMGASYASDNALSFYLARDTGPAGTFGNVDVLDIKIRNFGVGGLPTDIATSILNHYTGERAYYGV